LFGLPEIPKLQAAFTDKNRINLTVPKTAAMRTRSAAAVAAAMKSPGRGDWPRLKFNIAAPIGSVDSKSQAQRQSN
jgi:hypothetical protein